MTEKQKTLGKPGGRHSFMEIHWFDDPEEINEYKKKQRELDEKYLGKHEKTDRERTPPSQLE